jgi:uncharacterized protein (TIGR04255 family)
MTAADQAIVTYEAPPVTEVVVAIAFRPLSALTVAHLGVFWRDHLEDQFPTVMERPPYDPPLEDFEGPSSTRLSLSLEEGFPAPRLWFRSADEQDLIQVQRDWFACNWRKVGPTAEYGRWSSRRRSLERWLGSFQQYLESNNLGVIQPVQCEVTYINHIEPNEYWDRHGQLDRVFRLLRPTPGSLPEPEQMQFQVQYLIMGAGSENVGRLHVNCTPVRSKKDGTPALALSLTARGLPLTESMEGAFGFLDLARERIVHAFDELTTEDMHRVWRREE